MSVNEKIIQNIQTCHVTGMHNPILHTCSSYSLQFNDIAQYFVSGETLFYNYTDVDSCKE